jgi:hypothetical protein
MGRTRRLAVVRAANTAAHMAGSIHDDEVARRLGYRGGIVSGVVLYTHVVEACGSLLGPSWFERGAVRMRFGIPIYEGERIAIDQELDPAAPDGEIALAIRKEWEEAVCATFRCGPGRPLPTADEYPPGQVPDEVAATPEERFLRTEHLAADRLVPSAEDVRGFLERLGVTSDRWAELGRVHPAYLFRTYVAAGRQNQLFRDTAPIHVASDLLYGGLACVGEPMSRHGRVRGLRSERGHRYVDYDVLWLREGDGHPLLLDRHTAIYRRREGPRRPVSGAV